MVSKLNQVDGGPFSRISGIAAIGFAIAIVLGNVVLVPAGLPRAGAEVGEVVAFFGAEQDLVAVASALAPVAWVLAALFGAGVVAALRPSEQERGEAWSLAGFAGLVLQNATFTGVIAIRLTLGPAVEAGADGPGVAGLWALHDALFTLNGTFLALALLGLSVGGVRAGLVRPWHATLGLVAATLLFGSAVLTPLIITATGPIGLLGLVGWLLWVAWIVGYGAALIRLTPAATR